MKICRLQGRCKPGDLPSVLDDDFLRMGGKDAKKPLIRSGGLFALFSPYAVVAFGDFFWRREMLKRKLISLFLVVLSLFCLVACDKEDNTGALVCEVVSVTDTRVVISVSEKDGSFTVLDCMEALQEKKALSFTISDSMITEINGKANASDFSGCWMLYTSDTEMSNAEWGSVEYDGKTLNSAILGAEALAVEVGELYVWEYVIF